MSKQEKPQQESAIKTGTKELPEHIKAAVNKKQEYVNKPVYK